jgi:hypothetical protein
MWVILFHSGLPCFLIFFSRSGWQFGRMRLFKEGADMEVTGVAQNQRGVKARESTGLACLV